MNECCRIIVIFSIQVFKRALTCTCAALWREAFCFSLLLSLLMVAMAVVVGTSVLGMILVLAVGAGVDVIVGG